MSRPFVRNTPFLFSLCLALGFVAAAAALVPQPIQRLVASISSKAPSSSAPPATQGNRAPSFHEEQRSDDSQRKSADSQHKTADAVSRPAERQSVQRQDDDALTSPGKREEEEEEAGHQEDEEEDDPDLPGFLRGRLKISKEEYLRQRAEHIGQMRGFGDDPLHVKRADALRQMEQQLR